MEIALPMEDLATTPLDPAGPWNLARELLDSLQQGAVLFGMMERSTMPTPPRSGSWGSVRTSLSGFPVGAELPDGP